MAMARKVIARPDEIRKGDQMIGTDGLVQWVAEEDADPIGDRVYCAVRFIDGGRDIRTWHAAIPCTIVVLRA